MRAEYFKFNADTSIIGVDKMSAAHSAYYDNFEYGYYDGYYDDGYYDDDQDYDYGDYDEDYYGNEYDEGYESYDDEYSLYEQAAVNLKRAREEFRVAQQLMKWKGRGKSRLLGRYHH